MEPNRNFMMGVGLVLAALSTIPIVLQILDEQYTVGSILFRVLIGLMLSLPLYLYTAWSRHKVKTGNYIPQKTTGSLYRYLIPTVVIGMLLGQIVWLFLGDDLKDALFLILSGWMFGTMCFLLFVAWRYAPKG